MQANDNTATAAAAAAFPEWRHTLPVDLRNHLVRQIVRATFPGPEAANPVLRPFMRRLVEYAQMVEGNIYERATSRAEYYNLLGERISSNMELLLAKRRRRAERDLLGGPGSHLMVLQHAQKCAQTEPPCTMPDCRTMKDVLLHMLTCTGMPVMCQVPHCWSSRQILKQWHGCVDTCECAVCVQLRLAE